MRKSILFLISIGLIVQSCRQIQENTQTITQRIQYDVTIKSPDPDLEWWVQNIEGMNREAFVTDLLEATHKGTVKTYDPFLLSAISPDQISRIGRRTDTLRMQLPVPPYSFYDTVINVELSIHDITRIRFLEEWKLNPKNMQVHKEVLGIAPLLESYDENGFLRGYQPMFWIFFDDDYPGKLRGKVL